MKKLPEITMYDWLAAEASLRVDKPIPGGYLTISKFGELRGIKQSRSSLILRELFAGGLAIRQKWRVNGRYCWIYKLKK